MKQMALGAAITPCKPAAALVGAADLEESAVVTTSLMRPRINLLGVWVPVTFRKQATVAFVERNLTAQNRTQIGRADYSGNAAGNQLMVGPWSVVSGEYASALCN